MLEVKSKQFFMLVMLLLVAVTSDAQNLGDVMITPENPTTNDNITVSIYWFPCGSFGLDGININNDTVSVELNYFCGILPPGGGRWHPVDLGQFPAGVYEFIVEYSGAQYHNEVITIRGPGPVMVNTLHPVSWLVMIVLLTLVMQPTLKKIIRSK